jgi:hypothetical protein
LPARVNSHWCRDVNPQFWAPLLSESAFREAYAAWHMAGGGPPVTTKWVTVTRSDMITLE